MADGNAGTVGFGFQADVVSTASLAHFLTGRMLKALSDGRVDLYALAAASTQSPPSSGHGIMDEKLTLPLARTW